MSIGAATAGGDAYGLYQTINQPDPNEEEGGYLSFPEDDQRKPFPVTQEKHVEFSPETLSDDDIVVAVDATPERAAGILRIPKWNTIYFYSVDLSKRFYFEDGVEDIPSQLEKVNGALSVDLFQDYLDTYREAYLEEGYQVVCKNASNSGRDADVKIVDKLTAEVLEKDGSTNEYLPIIIGLVSKYFPGKEYNVQNISEEEIQQVFEKVIAQFPQNRRRQCPAQILIENVEIEVQTFEERS